MEKSTIALVACLLFTFNTGCLGEFFKDEDNRKIIYLSKDCINYDEKERCWLILIPENMDLAKENPLIIDMHGIGGNMYLQHNLTRFANISEEYGVYVAYPQGFNNEWNMADDLCCGDDDDFGFILRNDRKLLHKKYAVDESRIYSTGWSNGCGMTQRLAAQASEMLQPLLAHLCIFWDEPSPDYSPIPFMEIHGLVDELVHYPSVSSSRILLWSLQY